MGTVGDALDNAVAESFFASLQNRAPRPPPLDDARATRTSHFRVDRGFLQPAPPALDPRHAQPFALRRCEPRPARGMIATTTPNPSGKPGELQTSVLLGKRDSPDLQDLTEAADTVRYRCAYCLREIGRRWKYRHRQRATRSPTFTIETYQHVLPGLQAEAARTFQELVTPALPSAPGRRPEGRPASGTSYRGFGRRPLISRDLYQTLLFDNALAKKDPSHSAVNGVESRIARRPPCR
jgi:hypothetical protein